MFFIATCDIDNFLKYIRIILCYIISDAVKIFIRIIRLGWQF